jgi:hypothetical protein
MIKPKTEPIVNYKIKAFIQALGKEEKKLSDVGRVLDLTKNNKGRTFLNALRNLCLDHFLIENRKEGRNCFVKLNKNGLWYLDFFNRMDKR